MTRPVPAAWACLLLSASVFAGQAPTALPPDAPSAANGTLSLHARPSVEIAVGGVPIELEKTTLVQLQKALGGTIVRSGAPGEGTFGLCYLARVGDRRSRVWVLSDEDMGADHTVDSVLASAEADDQPAPPNCSELKGATTLKLGTAEIGSPLAEVETRLGHGRKQRHGWLGYSYNARAGSSALSQYVFLAIGANAGTVNDLFVQQTTSQASDN